MADDNMIERVACALYAATPFKDTEGGFESQSETYKRMCRLLARAAIQEMRRPTDDMRDAGWRNNFQRYADAAWEAMIDEALEWETVAGPAW